MARTPPLKYVLLFRRERADGTVNETGSSKTFQGWLKRCEEGDRFFVALLRWVEAEVEELRSFGDEILVRIRHKIDVEGVDNSN